MSSTPPRKPCVFCEIIGDRQAPPRDYHNYGPVVRFEPLNPVTPGHRLFVPTAHVDKASDDPWLTAVTVNYAADYASGACDDFNLIVNSGAAASQTIFHLHWHVVPRRPDDELSLPWDMRR